jgi:CHAT domain-containing protein
VVGAPAITGAAFSDRAVMDESARGDLAGFQVLHFATHGLPETKAGCLRVPPALVTTLAPPVDGAAPSDGLLSFAEIAGLRLDANLVVLSACETAAGVSGVGGRLGGQDESGSTLDGLVRAFVTANARAVLATYWKVPASESSDAFIRAFYASGRTATIGAALRDAQLAAMKRPETSHPYYWGAYFLVGDASKSMLTPAPATVAAR